MVKRKKSKKPKRLRNRNNARSITQNAVNESQKRLMERTLAQPYAKDIKIHTDSASTEKMSEVIIDFARPILKETKDFEQEKRIFSIAILAWNLSLLPKDQQAGARKEFENFLGNSKQRGERARYVQEVLDFLLDRKQTFFPDNHRYIFDYDIVETPGGFHLNVASNVI